MTRTFIEVPLFSKRWKEIGLGEDELQELQIMLLNDPESGPDLILNKINNFDYIKVAYF